MIQLTRLHLFLEERVEMFPKSIMIGLALVYLWDKNPCTIIFLASFLNPSLTEPKPAISTPLASIIALQQDVKTTYVHTTMFKSISVL